MRKRPHRSRACARMHASRTSLQRPAIVAIALGAALALAACGGGGDDDRPAPTRGSALPYERAEIVTADGVKLAARVWGSGATAVVLAHGFSEGVAQDAWLEYPDELADRGLMALTFNFRGFCGDRSVCSDGDMELGKNWRDVVAAVDHARSRGAKRVFVIGASMGGLAALRAAQTMELDGVVSLATPQFPHRYYSAEPRANDLTRSRLHRIAEPKLFMAGSEDVQLRGGAPGMQVDAVRFAADARRMHAWSREPKQLAILDSVQHSSDLVTTDEDDKVRRAKALIDRFISGERR